MAVIPESGFVEVKLAGLQMSQDVMSPIQALREQADLSDRHIENCWWYHEVNIDFDLPPVSDLMDPQHLQLMNQLQTSSIAQGHRSSGIPNESSDMIIGFHNIPEGEGNLMERVLEVDPMMILKANKSYKINAFQKNYTVVVTLAEDIAQMDKREAEKITRMLMARLGALKILMIHPDDEGRPKYYALGTMEGGLAIEDAGKEGAIDRLRDRLVTHACAKESGSFDKKPNVVNQDEWERSNTPEYIASTSRQLAKWGYIDKPFDLRLVCSKERADKIQMIMGWSRQSESAIAAYMWDVNIPVQYHMGQATGTIVSSRSGKWGADKTKLQREETIPVAIVPRQDYHPGPDDPLSLYGFDRYSLGIEGQNIYGPSIEFDEMSAAILHSGLVRVRRDYELGGFILDDEGEIFLPRVRGFVHIHQGVREIQSGNKYWERTATDLVEYVPANFTDYPYPVGCGRDIMFACSTDATRRSKSVRNIGSGVQVVLFDALDHGTNVLLLTEPIPGTNFIPDSSFETFLTLVDKENGAVKFTDELAMV